MTVDLNFRVPFAILETHTLAVAFWKQFTCLVCPRSLTASIRLLLLFPDLLERLYLRLYALS